MYLISLCYNLLISGCDEPRVCCMSGTRQQAATVSGSMVNVNVGLCNLQVRLRVTVLVSLFFFLNLMLHISVVELSLIMRRSCSCTGANVLGYMKRAKTT